MHRHLRIFATAATTVLLTGSAIAGTAAQASTPSGLGSGGTVSGSVGSDIVTTLLPSCSHATATHAGCMAELRAHQFTLSNGRANTDAASSQPKGYGPAALRSAYNLPTATRGKGQTVGIVDAFNDPTAGADMNAYRVQYGLPACTAASGCFRQLNQRGGTKLPKVDTGWAVEESLDLDMISAVAPKAHIILIEAASTAMTALAVGVNRAVALGATVISTSYGTTESSGIKKINSAYEHPHIPITAAAGDFGYGVAFPASSPWVTAVGGTALTRATNARGWSEVAWGSAPGLLGLLGNSPGTGSGCSTFEPKPAWQKSLACSNRTVADVAAVADPNTGLAVYDTTASKDAKPGWLMVGGTSASSQIIGGVYALAGNGGASKGASRAYAHPHALYDVTSGTDGSCTGLLGLGESAKRYLCTAQPGYDGPTGLGTPNGLAAF